MPDSAVNPSLVLIYFITDLIVDFFFWIFEVVWDWTLITGTKSPSLYQQTTWLLKFCLKLLVGFISSPIHSNFHKHFIQVFFGDLLGFLFFLNIRCLFGLITSPIVSVPHSSLVKKVSFPFILCKAVIVHKKIILSSQSQSWRFCVGLCLWIGTF